MASRLSLRRADRRRIEEDAGEGSDITRLDRQRPAACICAVFPGTGKPLG